MTEKETPQKKGRELMEKYLKTAIPRATNEEIEDAIDYLLETLAEGFSEGKQFAFALYDRQGEMEFEVIEFDFRGD